MRIFQKHIILLLIITQFIQIQAQCPNLICQSPNEANEGNCFDFDEKSQQIKMYQNSCEMCQILISTTFNQDGTVNTKGLESYKNCQSKSNLYKKYSGEECEKNEDCQSNECKSENNKKVCNGQDENAECDEQKFCNQGLTCINGSCKKIVDLEQKCNSLDECSNEAFCLNQKCVKYGSAQIGELIEKIDSDTIDLRCQSFLLGKDGKCIDSNIPFVIQSCPSQKKCQNSNELNYKCNLFSAEKTYNKSGGLTQNMRQLVSDLSQKIMTKNKSCPTNLKLSHQCHLITYELEELKELQYLYQNMDIFANMSNCLHDRLLYKQSYDKFVSEIKALVNEEVKIENENVEQKKEDNANLSSQSEESNSNTVIVIVVIFVFLICVVGAFIFLKKRRLSKLLKFEDSSEVQDSASHGKRPVSKSKDKPNNLNVSNHKVSLNLEYNPTSAKGENQFDVSQLNGGSETNKNAHLETSVNHNFFSIDGDEEKEAKMEEQIEENRTGSDVSYENVFNIEGDNIDQPNSQRKRRRQTNRKKIVKNSEKTYAVVEE